MCIFFVLVTLVNKAGKATSLTLVTPVDCHTVLDKILH